MCVHATITSQIEHIHSLDSHCMYAMPENSMCNYKEEIEGQNLILTTLEEKQEN